MQEPDGLDVLNLVAMLSEEERMVSDTVHGWVKDRVLQKTRAILRKLLITFLFF